MSTTERECSLFARPYCFSCSIAARISGTTSEQNRSATASNRVAISRVHLTTNVSGLNSSLPKRPLRPSAADSSEPIVTAAFKQASLSGTDELDHERTSMASAARNQAVRRATTSRDEVTRQGG